MALIVDTSVALKWVLAEEGSDRAVALFSERLAAPEFILLECANVLATKVRRGLLTASQANETWPGLADMKVRLVPVAPALLDRARNLAVETSRSAYDSLYLALAIAEGAQLVTADRKFFNALQEYPRYAAVIRLL